MPLWSRAIPTSAEFQVWGVTQGLAPARCAAPTPRVDGFEWTPALASVTLNHDAGRGSDLSLKNPLPSCRGWMIRRGSYTRDNGKERRRQTRPKWVDAVEKGKNEPIEIFAFAPVETGFS
jgi:hypothetical protein